jgi:uncharacterized protein with HEPN domain
MKDDRMYIGHIRDAIEKISEYIGQNDYKNFASNDMLIDAVVRNLEIIGEAANHLSTEFCHNQDQIKWRNIIDMRNLLIHNYAGVNIKVVWDTCTIDLPKLKSQLDSNL